LLFGSARDILTAMTEPLALVVYEKLLPGTQLVNRLQDLKYRVKAITDASTLLESARREKPLIILADVFSSRENICDTIARLKKEQDTQHIPVIAFAADETADKQKAVQEAGATLVVSDTAIVNHLSQFLEQALQVE
jgi:CheY-like chemotaxis protein